MLGKIGYASTKQALDEAVAGAPKALALIEEALATERANDGPFFNGDAICLIDAAYAPFLQRFAINEAVLQTGLLNDFPLVQAWSDALMANETVSGAVPDNFSEVFDGNHRRRETYVWSLKLGHRSAAE